MIRFFPFAYHLHEDRDGIYILVFAYDVQGRKIAVRFPYNFWFYAAIDGTKNMGYSDIKETLEPCRGISIDDPDTVGSRYSTRDLHRPKPVVRIRCKTNYAKKEAIRVLGEIGVSMHEVDDKLDPVLKLLAERGLVRYQWMEAEIYPAMGHLTVWEHEYEGVVDTLIPVKEDIPTPDLSILSWDIETNSANWNKFPMPQTHPDNYITIIGVTFWAPSLGNTAKQGYQEHVLIYGPEIEAPSGLSMEERGIKVHTYGSELGLIRGFLGLIRELDPDILVGHNIFDFDIPYVTKRYSQLIMELMNYPGYKGPRYTHIPNISRLKTWESPTRPVEWNNSQIAVTGSYVDLPGRIWLDTRIIAARNLFGPLKNKKLDTIGQTILGMPKNDMPHREMFKIFKFFMEEKVCTQENAIRGLEYRVRLAYEENVKTYNKALPTRPKGPITMNSVIELQSLANILDQRGNKRVILMAKDVPMDGDKAKKFLEAKYEAMRKECESLVEDWNVPLEPKAEHTEEAIKHGMTRMIQILWWFVAMYCLQDTRIPLQALQKQSIIPVLREQASIFAVEMADTLIKGQIYTTTCAQYSYVYKMGFMMDFGMPGGPTGYYEVQGGFVAECKPGLKTRDNDSVVFVLDFASLYPTVIIAYNICYSTWIPEHMRNAKDPQYIWILYADHIMAKIAFLKAKEALTEDEAEDLRDLEAIMTVDVESRGQAMCNVHPIRNEKLGKDLEHWFLKPCIMEGILPHMLWRQYLSRKEIKNKMGQAKKAGNAAMVTTYNAQQLAVKVSMNASYGGLSTQSNRLANFPAAEITTYLGRTCIQACNKKLIEWGEDEVVYNDTDSAMILIPRITERFGRDPERISAHGHDVAKRLSSLFPKPMGMECENFFISFLLKAKKNYAAIKWDGSSLDIDHYTRPYVDAQGLLYMKGLAPVRNDKFGLNKILFTDLLYMILTKRGINSIIQRLEETIEYMWSFTKPGAITRDNIDKVISLFSYNMGLTPEAYRGNSSAMSGWANKYATIYGMKPKPGEKFELVVAEPRQPITKANLGSGVKHTKSADSLSLPEWLLDPSYDRQLDILHYLLCFKNNGNVIDLVRLAYPDEVHRQCMTKYYIPILIEEGHIPCS